MKDTDVQIHCGCGPDETRPGPQACRKGRQCVIVIPEDDLFRIVMELPEFQRRYNVSEQENPLENDANKDESFDSTDDKRTTNNVMRHAYRPLTEEEKGHMKGIKDHGLATVNLLHMIGGTDPNGERQGSRELSIAQTKIEEAVMWAVKHVTR